MATFNDYANYNKFVNLSYNIIEKLFENENIWKILKYDTPDALNPSKANLTTAEKIALIYKGGEDSQSFRVFQQMSTDDAFPERSTQLRIYPMTLDPTQRTIADVDIIFEIISHSKLNTLENNTTRLDNLQYELLNTLNGQDVKGVGVLFFDKEGRTSNSSRIKLSNNKNYFGYALVMSTRVA